jgi:hypothetical protein
LVIAADASASSMTRGACELSTGLALSTLMATTWKRCPRASDKTVVVYL